MRRTLPALLFAALLPAQAPQDNRVDSAAALLLEGRRLFEEHRYADSLNALQRSLSFDSRNAETYKLIALAGIRMNRLDIAEPALHSAARIAPDDYLVHFHLGALYYTRSLFLQARPELEKASTLKPDYMPARLFLGLTLEEVGDEKSTIEQYQKAIDLAARSRAAAEVPHIYLGRYYYRLDRFEDSLASLRKAVGLNPASADAQGALGKTLHALNRDEEAVPALQRAVEADPQNGEAHYLLFRIFSAQGRDADAQEELRRFQSLKPEQKDDPRRRRVN